MSDKCSDIPGEIELFVSLHGSDRWSGRLPAPSREGADGPLATLEAAKRAVRKLRSKRGFKQTIRVHIRSGRYELKRPLVFGPQDSGRLREGTWRKQVEPEHPVIYSAYRNEKPVVSGGRRITGWKVAKLGKRKVWVADLPDVRKGKWYFRQLWVNGKRRMRPRLPGKGEYRIAEVPGARFKGGPTQTWRRGTRRFIYAEGDIDPSWKNINDVELTFFTLWISIRTQIKSVNRRKRLVEMDRNSGIRLTHGHSREGAPYYVENVFEELKEPGQWYLDRKKGKLYYIPKRGERRETAEVVAPYLQEVVRVEGRGRRGAGRVRFEGLTFSHNEWKYSKSYAGSIQAAHEVPGAVILRNARNCVFRDCTFSHLGTCGVELAENCSDITVERCRIRDLGGGGVKIWHGCRRNTVTDCEIGNGGILFQSAVGVLIGKSSGNKILHNHIHDFCYTGISVGWTWGYDESGAYGNIIEWNHIHDIGKRKLSDMGGIYTLGVSTGTRLRYNLIHDVYSRTYGGWAIYPDEGSTDILIENNICYRTKSTVFHVHYSKNVLVRNNIFAFGGEAQIAFSRKEDHLSFIFERNIVYFRTGTVLSKGYAAKEWTTDNVMFRNNLYWDASGRQVDFAGLTLKEWRKRGMEKGTSVSNPKFVNPAKFDFRLRKNSPALKIGFVPFDLSNVGPRP